MNVFPAPSTATPHLEKHGRETWSLHCGQELSQKLSWFSNPSDRRFLVDTVGEPSQLCCGRLQDRRSGEVLHHPAELPCIFGEQAKVQFQLQVLAPLVQPKRALSEKRLSRPIV